MKKTFCCDASRGMYEDYYMRQSGGGGGGADIPVFAGARFQKGHGLGSILSGLFRRVLPYLKGNLRNFATSALQTGADVVADVFDDGKKFTDSLKQRVPQGIKRTFDNFKLQTGSGRAKRRKYTRSNKSHQKRRVQKKKKKTNKKSGSIFDCNGFRTRTVL